MTQAEAIEKWEEGARKVLDLTVFNNPYIKMEYDNPRQLYFLTLMNEEVMYGGSAGGGKSVGLLAAALQFVQSPGYSALLLRKTFQDLNQPGALIPRAHEWLGGTDAHWKEAEHSWTFPTRSVLKFGYLDSPSDIYQFQSSEFCFIGFDEGTQFREYDYRYMFSRLRKPAKLNLPLRMRMGTNPGGIGHEWVKRRFLVEGRQNGRFFVPAGLRDNPHLNPAEYEQSLAQLDPITRRQLLNGDWSARAGGLFRTEWFNRIIPVRPVQVRNWVRFWDLAATAPKPGTDPDYTAGCLIGMHDGTIYIADMKRIRDKPRVIENLIRTTAQLDGRSVRVRMEEELGSAGKNLIDHYQRHILPGMDFAGVKPTGDSQVLAGPLASAAEAGNVVLVRGVWNGPFMDELESFPEGCLHGDTLIWTYEGNKRIRDVRAGDSCLTRSGWRKVTRSVQTGVRSTINRFGIRATPEHLIRTTAGWIPLYKVRESHKLILCGKQLASMGINIGSLMDISSGGIMPAERNFTVSVGTNGSFIAGLFQKALRFTTRMAILLMTTLKTWNVSCRRTIESVTVRTEYAGVGRSSESGSICPENYACAAWSIIDTYKGISPEQCAELINNAPGADVILSLPAKMVSILIGTARIPVGMSPPCKDSGSPVPVFDLTVAGEHEFFANGVLVHNSHDDQIKAACLGLQEVVARPGQFKMWIPKAPPAQLPAM